MRFLEKYTPANDKLKHFFWGALGFLFLNLFFEDVTSVGIVFLLAWITELYQRFDGGTNTIKEMFKDVFFGVLLGVIISLVNLF